MDSIYLTEARVYIAGVLMPTIRVVVTSTFNRPPVASITLPAYSELLSLGERDRVPVHVFVKETMVENPEFILLFEGFVTSSSYSNSAMRRVVILSAISYFDVLNDIKIKFLTNLEEIFSAYAGQKKDLVHNIVAQNMVFPFYLFQYGINPQHVEEDSEGSTSSSSGEGNSNNKLIRFPSDFLENIYAFVQLAHPPAGTKNEKGELLTDENGKPYEGTAPKGPLHSSALTDYYGRLARTLKFLDRYERLPFFDLKVDVGNGEMKYAWEFDEAPFKGYKDQHSEMFPMLYGLKTEEAVNLVSFGISRYANKDQSIMQILNFLVGSLEYEYLFISNPAYTGRIMEVKNKTTTEKYPAKLISSCLKPLLTDSVPPKCNVLFRTHVNSLDMDLVHKGVPTRALLLNTYSQLSKIDVGSDFMNLYGLVDYYPSPNFPKFELQETTPEGVNKYKQAICTEVLEEERFTGPWVYEMQTPPWFHWLKRSFYENVPDIELANGEKVPFAKVYKERFFRRQLLNAKYFIRRLNAQCIFNPYITPGFPAVIFDSGDSNFAFAGHINTVEHTISKDAVSTNLGMNFIRPLREAINEEIPNPLVSIQCVTHNASRMTHIYQKLLGCDAVSFKEIENISLNPEDTSSGNVNPNSAYKFNRRNIASFDEYINFMDFKVEYSDGPEGPKTPVMLSGKLLNERHPMYLFDTLITYDPVIPNKEEILGRVPPVPDKTTTTQKSTPTYGESAEEIQKRRNEEIKQRVAEVQRLMSSYKVNINLSKEQYDQLVLNGLPWELGNSTSATAEPTDAEKIAKLAEVAKQQTKVTSVRSYTTVDMRILLREIAKREFDKRIYK